MQFYITRSGVTSGPFTQQQLESMIAAGILTPHDLACTEGMPEWRPLHILLPLGLGASRPSLPPLPPQAYAAAGLPALTIQPGEPRGVGGWLLVFCILNAIGGPLGIFGALFRVAMAVNMAPDIPAVHSAAEVEALAFIFFNLYAFIIGLRVWGGTLKGRDIANTYLNCRLVGVILAEFVVLVIMAGVPESYFPTALGNFGFIVITEILRFAIWKSYFKSSRRVRNTYG